METQRYGNDPSEFDTFLVDTGEDMVPPKTPVHLEGGNDALNEPYAAFKREPNSPVRIRARRGEIAATDLPEGVDVLLSSTNFQPIAPGNDVAA